MKKPDPELRPETLSAQGLGWVAAPYHDVAPPLYTSTTYERAADGSFPGGRIYARDQNPTFDQVEAMLAKLEGGHAAMVFASGVGAVLAVDSTLAATVFTRPLSLGADVVMHSATKYLNGHSDVVAGALVTREDSDLWQRMRVIRAGGGAVLGPFEAWLLLRGMRTLHVRVAVAARNAQAIAEHFSTHAKVLQVLYPGLPSHPGHAVAAKQMRGGFGGMLSIRVKGGEAPARAFAGHLQLVKRATSLGSTESLAEHRASVEGPDTICPPDLVRLSIGIEHLDDLIADLTQALDRL